MLEFVCCPFTTKIWLEVLLTDYHTTVSFWVIRINFFVLKSFTLWQCLLLPWWLHFVSRLFTAIFTMIWFNLQHEIFLIQHIINWFWGSSSYFFQSEIMHEAEVMMKLDHPNIVRIIGKYRVTEGHFYFQSDAGLMLETHQF